MLLHGVRADRRHTLGRGELLAEMGFHVLAYDARGCGESEGDCISFGWHERADLLAAVDWMHAMGIPNVVCIGMSQGAATILMASEGLAERNVRAIVVEAPYATLRDAVENRFRRWSGAPAGVLGAIAIPVAESLIDADMDDISPVAAAPSLTCPAILVTGELDYHVRADESQAVFDALPEPKRWWVVPKAYHADYFWFDQPGYRQQVGDFLRAVMAEAAP